MHMETAWRGNFCIYYFCHCWAAKIYFKIYGIAFYSNCYCDHYAEWSYPTSCISTTN